MTAAAVLICPVSTCNRTARGADALGDGESRPKCPDHDYLMVPTDEADR